MRKILIEVEFTAPDNEYWDNQPTLAEIEEDVGWALTTEGLLLSNLDANITVTEEFAFGKT